MGSTVKKIILISLGFFMKTQAMAECIALSNGKNISIAHYENGFLNIENTLFQDTKASSSTWPSYSNHLKILIFESIEDGVSGIYKSHAEADFKNRELISYGKYPALSPNGNKIAYINEHKNIAINDIISGEISLVSLSYERLSLWMRPIWINNDEIVYVKENYDVFIFNQKTKTSSIFFEHKLFPIAAQNGIIFFTDKTAKKLYEYKYGKLTTIFNNNFLSLGPGIVLLNKGLLYSRQSWQNMTLLSETQDVFFLSKENNREKKLIKNYSIMGVTLIPCESTQKNYGITKK